MSIRRKFQESSGSGQSYTSCWSLTEKNEPLLSVRENSEGKNVLLHLEGNLRSDTAVFFKDELLALATTDSDVVLDCEGLSGISSSCQRALIEAQQLMDSIGRGTLTLVKVPSEIMDDFNSSGVAGALMIE